MNRTGTDAVTASFSVARITARKVRRAAIRKAIEGVCCIDGVAAVPCTAAAIHGKTAASDRNVKISGNRDPVCADHSALALYS